MIAEPKIWLIRNLEKLKESCNNGSSLHTYEDRIDLIDKVINDLENG